MPARSCHDHRGLVAFLLVMCVLLRCITEAAANNNTDCGLWSPNSTQNVTIGANMKVTFAGATCNNALRRINITVFCSSGATILFDRWIMTGGYVRIAGPPTAPWSVKDISLMVTSSVISATSGPALGIELGFGWPNSSAAHFTATNVTMIMSHSTVSSVLSVGVASVLACTFIDPSAGSSNTSFTSVFFALNNSTVIATTHGSVAAVAGLSVTQASNVIVKGFSFSLTGSHALAQVDRSAQLQSAATVAGVSIGVATSVAASTGAFSVVGSVASCIVIAQAVVYWMLLVASSVSGFAVGSVMGATTMSNVTQSVSSSSVSSSGDCNNGVYQCTSTSSVCGVAIGQITSDAFFSNMTQVISWSNVTCSTPFYTYAASSVAGVSCAYSGGAMTINGITQYISWSNISSNSASTVVSIYAGYSASGVAAVVLASLSLTFSILNANQYVSWSSANSSSSGAARNVMGGSCVGGVALGSVGSIVTATNITQSVTWSVSGSNCSSIADDTHITYAASGIGALVVATCDTVLTTSLTQVVAWSLATSIADAAYVASCIGGAGFGSTFAVTMNMTEQFVNLTEANCAARSNSVNADTQGVVCVAGVAVGHATDAFTMNNATQFLSFSNITNSVQSRTVGSSRRAFAASSAAGVAIAFASSGLATSNVTEYLSQSNVSSTVSSSTPRNGSFSEVAYAASGVCSIALGYTPSFVVMVNTTSYVGSGNVLSRSESGSGAGDAYSVSTVGGTGIGHAYRVTMNTTTQYLSWCNATSMSSSTSNSTTSQLGLAASNVAGVAIGLQPFNPIITTLTQFVTQSVTNSSSTCSGSTTSLTAVSAVAGISTFLAPTLRNVWRALSRSQVASCAQGLPSGVRAVCGDVVVAQCCVNVSLGNVTLLPPIVTLVLPPPVPLLFELPIRRTTTTSITRRSGSGTSSSSLSRSVNQTSSLTSTPSTSRSASRNASLTRTAATMTQPATETPNASCSTSFSTRSASPSSDFITGTQSSVGRSTSPSVTRTSSATGLRSATLTPSASTSMHSQSVSGSGQSRSPSLSLLDVVALTPLVPEAVRTTTVSLAASSAVASIGSGSTGASAGRISVTLQLAVCDDAQLQEQEQRPVDRASHPLGFGVPAAGSRVQYDAGMVLGNTLLGVVALVVHFLVTRARAAVGSRSHSHRTANSNPMIAAAMWSRFPGLSSAVHLYLLPLIAQASTSCLMRGSMTGVMIGLWGLLLTVALFVGLLYATTVSLSQFMECGTPFKSSTEPWLLRPRFLWKALPSSQRTTEQLCVCFGAYFEDYQYHGRWWLSVEVATAVVCGTLSGLAGPVTCPTVQLAAIVPNVGYLAAVAFVRPYQRQLDFISSVAVSTLVLASCVAVRAGSMKIASGAALGASIVGFVPALSAPYKLLQQYRALQREKELQLEAQRRGHPASLLVTDALQALFDSDRVNPIEYEAMMGNDEGLSEGTQPPPDFPPELHDLALGVNTQGAPVAYNVPQPPVMGYRVLADEEFDEPAAFMGSIGVVLSDHFRGGLETLVAAPAATFETELDALLDL